MDFHLRVGNNLMVGNNRRTIEKLNVKRWGNAVAVTSRPLNNDELFEVILDIKGSKFSGGFGIGVLTVRPEEFQFPRFAYNSPHAWMYQYGHIWNNGTLKRRDYGVDLDKLPAGTIFGVMKKSSGVVHFFVDGVDKGSAVSGVSGPVYGVTDLHANALMITILKP